MGKWDRGEGGVSVLTVGDTLILDLQVLVGPWAGVREHIRPRHHHTLGAVVTPVRGDRASREREIKKKNCGKNKRRCKRDKRRRGQREKKTPLGYERRRERLGRE